MNRFLILSFAAPIAFFAVSGCGAADPSGPTPSGEVSPQEVAPTVSAQGVPGFLLRQRIAPQPEPMTPPPPVPDPTNMTYADCNGDVACQKWVTCSTDVRICVRNTNALLCMVGYRNCMRQ